MAERAVLFADVVGSTALGERLDPETVRHVVGGCVARVASVVESYGGAVHDVLGDGVLCSFDDAASALAAGYRVTEAVADHAASVEDAYQVAGIDIRVGVHSGAVRLSPGTAGHRARLGGPAVRAAVALEAAAQPGTVLAGEETLGRATGAQGSAVCRELQVGRLALTARTLLSPPPRAQQATSVDVALPPELREARKVVTALFLDLAPGPGSSREAALRAVADVVAGFGGRVQLHSVGAPLVAVFGAPTAHEDDAERAVRGALAAASLHRVRVGVATGLAVVGRVGAGRHVSYDATGDVMNTAARVQQAARSGQVLVDLPTYHRVSRAFAWGEQREVEAKGKQSPVPARPALAVRADPHATPEGPLLGRDAESEVLRELLKCGSEGSGGALLVEGPAGIGKSRLLAWARGASPPGVVWLVEGCPPWSTARFGPVAGLLRQLVAGLGGDDAEAGLRHVSPFAADVVRALLELSPGAPAPDEDRLVDDVVEATAAVASSYRKVLGRGLVLAVEDLHRAHPDSVAVLGGLAERAADLGLLVLATARPGPADVPLLGPTAQVLRPAALDDVRARALLEHVVGRGALTYDEERAVLDTAAGNPLFLWELSRSLLDGEHAHAGAAGLPDTVERVVLARVDRLDPPTLDLLTAAAVLRTFDAPLVGEVSQVPGTPATLRRLERLGLLSRSAQGWGFAHDLVREVVTSTVLAERRRSLHERAARALTRRDPADVDEGALAAHWEQAGFPEQSWGPATSAARHAAARLSYDEAVELASLALRTGTAAGVGPQVRIGLLLALADLQRACGRLEEAMRTYVEAAQDAAGLGDAVRLARAALGHEDALFASRLPRGGPDDHSVRLLGLARDRLGDGEPDLAVRVRAALVRALAYQGDRTRAASEADAAVAAARRDGGPASVAYALIAWRAAYEAPEHLPLRRARATELAQCGQRSGDPELAVEALRLRMVDDLKAGAVDDAFAAIAALEERILALRRRDLLWYPPMWRAMRALLTGRLDEAVEAVEDFFERGRQARYRDVQAVYGLQRFLLLRGQDRLDRVPALLSSLPADVADRLLTSVGAAAARTGDVALARHVVDELRRRPGDLLPENLAFTVGAAMAAETVAFVGDGELAEHLYRRLLAWDGQLLVVGAGAACLGPCGFPLGLLAATAGDRRAADRHLREALRTSDRLGLPLAARDALAALERLGTHDLAASPGACETIS